MANVLSRQPVNPNSLSESSDDDKEWETISYELVCQILDHHLDLTKMLYHVKLEVQNNIVDVDLTNKSLGLKSTNLINVQLQEVKLFDTIMPDQMAQYHKKGHPNILCLWVCSKQF